MQFYANFIEIVEIVKNIRSLKTIIYYNITYYFCHETTL